METAVQADQALRDDESKRARSLFRQACAKESAAAERLVDNLEEEPTRSVLFRSAASLAIEGKQFMRAAYLIACGLEGTPPSEIREELRNLLRVVRRELLTRRAYAMRRKSRTRPSHDLTRSADSQATTGAVWERRNMTWGGPRGHTL